MNGWITPCRPSRCSAYWQEFTKCFSEAEHSKACTAQRDDYLECVHRTKEVPRNAQIQAEYVRQQTQALKDHKKDLDAQADGVPTRVGLIPTPPEESSLCCRNSNRRFRVSGCAHEDDDALRAGAARPRVDAAFCSETGHAQIHCYCCFLPPFTSSGPPVVRTHTGLHSIPLAHFEPRHNFPLGCALLDTVYLVLVYAYTSPLRAASHAARSRAQPSYCPPAPRLFCILIFIDSSFSFANPISGPDPI
ncbi:hypothetical protein B0H17DRAFT_964143 [Mycena rosella]|uniref:NADH dehydrogenase [ubiquinone] iron-sulfur protein 5 n=1 Tax=Mycena rosella TaxID=1033263 RepID=A0AAD7BJ92_MYCRO|nr:hypothetical protein B0H17DRAFT_964143 [Mycena rosella]